MRASAIEFRFRMLINTIIIFTGFWAPWMGRNAWGGLGPHVSLLEWFSVRVARLELLRFSAAVPLAIGVAALCAAVGAVLRVWGAAYLGPGTVQSFEMQAGSVMASGPFRFVRNPLYLGLWFMAAGLAFLMPPSGALFAMVLLSFFIVRLILGEEVFLAQRLGEPYLAYRRAVPRILPRLRGAPADAGVKPQWVRAALTELTPIGVFVALAFCSWSYDNQLMIKAILISVGLSLVTRAVLMGNKRAEPA